MTRIIKEDTVGQRIKAQRQRLGLTQENLASMLRLPKTTISTYENDKVDIKSSALVGIARALKTTPNYLLGYGDDLMVEEIGNLMRAIKSDEVKASLMLQIKAIAGNL